MTNVKLKPWHLVILACGFLSACAGVGSVRETSTPELEPTISVPNLRLVNPPETLCRDATQMRLQPVIESEWPTGVVAEWEIHRENEMAVIASGTWTPQERDLYIAFPDGEPLAPDDYVLDVRVNKATIADHTFSVQGVGPRLTSISLAPTPAGPAVAAIADLPRVFYLRYAYRGVCPGASLWLTVKHEEETVCSRNLTLQTGDGEGAVACYRDDGTTFQAGVYQATLTLAGNEGELTFNLGEDPEREEVEVETEAPVVYNPVCEPPFAAVGLMPDKTPYRPQERFEWYTQSVYVGAQCRDLPPSFIWVMRWYRNGEEVRVYRGRWQGGETGLLWDSLTGTEASPFLRPGTYTTTLALADEPPLEVGFRVVAYVPPE